MLVCMLLSIKHVLFRVKCNRARSLIEESDKASSNRKDFGKAYKNVKINQ